MSMTAPCSKRSQCLFVRYLLPKLPLPSAFRQQLPDEAIFDAALARVLAAEGARFADFSAALDEPGAYFDTDHLNRSGVATFIARSLMPLLQSRTP